VGHSEDEICIQNFRWKNSREGPLRRLTDRWEDNIKMDLR